MYICIVINRLHSANQSRIFFSGSFLSMYDQPEDSSDTDKNLQYKADDTEEYKTGNKTRNSGSRPEQTSGGEKR